MKNLMPTYVRPIQSKDEPQVHLESWDLAYDAGSGHKAITHVLNYINSDLLKGADPASEIDILKNHGSAVVRIRTEGEFLIVEAPFVKLTPETNRVALLRRVTEINFYPLTLTQIHLHGEELWFFCKIKKSLAQPNKVYDIIREVCVYADDYDDEFIEQYFAKFHHDKTEQHLVGKEADIVWNQIDTVLKEYRVYSDYFEQKRWDAFQWDIIVMSLLKLANMPYVNGVLRSKLGEYIANLYDGNIDFNFRINKGRNFMNELSERSRSDIMKDVYHTDRLISVKWRSSSNILQEEMKKIEGHVNNYNSKDDFFNLSFYLKGCFLKLIHDFNLDEQTKTAVQTTLEDCSGLEHRAAAAKLNQLYQQLYNGETLINKSTNGQTKNQPEKKAGFFTKLFG